MGKHSAHLERNIALPALSSWNSEAATCTPQPKATTVYSAKLVIHPSFAMASKCARPVVLKGCTLDPWQQPWNSKIPGPPQTDCISIPGGEAHQRWTIPPGAPGARAQMNTCTLCVELFGAALEVIRPPYGQAGRTEKSSTGSHLCWQSMDSAPLTKTLPWYENYWNNF